MVHLLTEPYDMQAFSLVDLIGISFVEEEMGESRARESHVYPVLLTIRLRNSRT